VLSRFVANLLPEHRRGAVMWTGGTLVLTRVAMIVAAVITARPLGPAGKGLVTAVVTWSQILSWLSIAGVNTAASVRVAESRATVVNRVVGNALVYSVIAGGTVAAFGAVLLPRVLGHLGSDVQPLVYLTIGLAPFIALTEILLAIHLALGRVVQYNVGRAIAPLVLMLVAVAAVATRTMTPTVFVIGVAAGSLATFAATIPRLPWRELTLAPREFFDDLRFGLKLMVASLMSFANARLDILFMSFWIAAGPIGLYSLANNVMSPVDLAASTLCVLITPAVARLGGTAGKGARAAQVDRVWADAIRAGAWGVRVVLPPAVAPPFLVPFLFGSAFSSAVTLIWILAPGYVLKSFAAVVVSGSAGMRLPWAASAVEAAGLIGSVALLPILLLAYGTTGAAIASTVSYGASAAAGAWLVRHGARRRGARTIEEAPAREALSAV
jgi:O-antigen/teichoic acid export membrane protein